MKQFVRARKTKLHSRVDLMEYPGWQTWAREQKKVHRRAERRESKALIQMGLDDR